MLDSLSVNAQAPMNGITATVIAVVTAASSVGVAWFTASATAGSQINAIDTKVQVVEERENNHYLELQTSLMRIENKLDEVLKP